MGLDINLYIEGPIPNEEFERGKAEFEFRIDGTTITRVGWADDLERIELDQEALMVRYWAPGYERGPWDRIAAWIEALRAAFPDRTVYYGSDSSHNGSPVDDELMCEYWAHWRSPHAHDYRNLFA